ncbi:DLW-39 family protein [Geodermatophilus sp. URMC 63]
MLKKLALAAVAAAGVAAVRRRSGAAGAGGKAEADLWHEATSGPQAVSRPTTR